MVLLPKTNAIVRASMTNGGADNEKSGDRLWVMGASKVNSEGGG